MGRRSACPRSSLRVQQQPQKDQPDRRTHPNLPTQRTPQRKAHTQARVRSLPLTSLLFLLPAYLLLRRLLFLLPASLLVRLLPSLLCLVSPSMSPYEHAQRSAPPSKPLPQTRIS